MAGYIKLSRKLFGNPLWTEPREYSRAEAWIDLIQSAKFESSNVILNGRAIEVQRGEIVASRRYLEQRWMWSNTKVDKFLNLLIEQGMITKRNATKNTIITLSNFSTYNDGNASENANQTPVKRQSNASKTPNIKKEKKDKKERESIVETDGNDVALHTQDEPSSQDLDSVFLEKEKSCGQKEKFEKFQGWILNNAPKVARLKEPFTQLEFERLKSDFDIEVIQNLLLAMHNYKPLLTKNESANLTFRAWAKRENNTTNGKNSRHTTTGKGEPPSDEELMRSVAEGISRARTTQEWQQ